MDKIASVQAFQIVSVRFIKSNIELCCTLFYFCWKQFKLFGESRCHFIFIIYDKLLLGRELKKKKTKNWRRKKWIYTIVSISWCHFCYIIIMKWGMRLCVKTHVWLWIADLVSKRCKTSYKKKKPTETCANEKSHKIE